MVSQRHKKIPKVRIDKYSLQFFLSKLNRFTFLNKFEYLVVVLFIVLTNNNDRWLF